MLEIGGREPRCFSDLWEPRGEGSPLHLAAATGDVARCGALIAEGAEVDCRTENGWTPLHVACNNKNGAVVRLLVEKGADVNARDENGITPLHRAVRGWWNWRTDMLPVFGGADTLERYYHDSEEKMVVPLRKDGAEWTEVVRLLVSNGAEVNAKDCENSTPLNYLLYQVDCFWPLSGNTEVANGIMRIVIEHGADVRNRGGWLGGTPLHQACWWRSPDTNATDIVAALLESGASVRDRDDGGQTPLHYAHLAISRLLLAHGADVDVADREGNTPLVCAANNGWPETCLFLLSRGAEADARFSTESDYGRPYDGATLLHCAARMHEGTSLCTELMAKGLKVTATDSKGETPLHYAAQRLNWGVCRLLLARGADADARSNRGQTPIFLSARDADYRGGDVALRQTYVALLEAGADVSVRDAEGNTPLHAAAKNSEKETCELLLAEGAEINATNSLGRTPLHESVHRGDEARHGVWRFLFANGADVDAKDAEGKTPLHYAHGEGPTDLLLAQGADISEKDNMGRTALHYAALRGNSGSCSLLIKHGADPDARDNEGNTPLSLARTEEYDHIVRELVAHGAKE